MTAWVEASGLTMTDCLVDLLHSGGALSMARADGHLAVLRDAHGNPVGASGSHRHATGRQRRALRAQWGSTCAVLGCASNVVVPHHVEPWWLSRHTRLPDLLPICEHHHHDVHEGARALRLRDGRSVTPTGWGHRTAAAA